MCHFGPGMNDVSTTFSELGEGATEKIQKIQDDLNEISIPFHAGQLQIQIMKFMKKNFSPEVYHFSDFHLPIANSAISYDGRVEDHIFRDAAWFYRTAQRDFWDKYLHKDQAQRLFTKSYHDYYLEIESRRNFLTDKTEVPTDCCTIGVGGEPCSLINFSNDKLDHTAAVWCEVKDRCSHDHGFLEALNLSKTPPSASSSLRSSKYDFDDEEVGENEDDDDDDDTDEEVQTIIGNQDDEDDDDDIITSSQKPVEGNRTGMLKLKKKSKEVV